MKRILTFILCIVMSFMFFGCSTLDKIQQIELPPLPTAQPEETAPPETPQPTETPAPAVSAETNHVVIGISRSTNEFYDPQNGAVKILTFSYDTPSVVIDNNEEATEAINEYIARMDETYITGNDYGVGTSEGMNLLLEMAQDNYYVAVQEQIELPLEFASDMTVRTKRIDDRCIDLVYTNYLYTGGAHGNYSDIAYVFDASTGERLTTEMLAGDISGLRTYLTDLMLQLVEENKDGYYSDRLSLDYVGGDLNTALSGLIRDGAWYFDSEGMCIFSTPYEIAPYASGIVEFHIPYEELSGHIDPRWLPVGYAGDGRLSLRPVSDIDDGSVEVLDRVAVSENGTELAVVADGSVSQVTLSKVGYADVFYETSQLWACSEMKDCALQILTDIPDGVPDLMLSYIESSGTVREFLITMSGEDGSLILVDKNSIQPRG
ncbi:MAG: DUF3298 domain-containing protein [Eubacteriales bacterium]|nr:DUF3298 domain-containing protein [Eubacteriales bacterium]